MPEQIEREPIAPETDHEILLEIWRDVKDFRIVRKAVFGNGEIGLIGRHEALSEKVEGVIRGIASRDKIAYAVVVAIGTLVLALLWDIFTGKVIVSIIR